MSCGLFDHRLSQKRIWLIAYLGLDPNSREPKLIQRNVFFDVRVFNPLAQSYNSQTLKAAHKTKDNQKKQEYGERILNVEHVWGG